MHSATELHAASWILMSLSLAEGGLGSNQLLDQTAEMKSAKGILCDLVISGTRMSMIGSSYKPFQC